MKKLLVFICCLLLALTAGCVQQRVPQQEISIPIMGDMASFEADDSFLKGAALALTDLTKDYPGYVFSAPVLDDSYSYEQGMLILDELVANNNVLAVLGSQSFAILDASAQRLEKAGKILVMPHGSGEEVTQRGYNYVFSNTFSPPDVGLAMEEYLADHNLRSIAVCYDKTDLSYSLIDGLTKAGQDDGVVVVDYVGGIITETEFGRIYSRWQALGVDGVVIIHGSQEAFRLVSLIRERDTELCIIGDYALDMPGMVADLGSAAENLVMAFIFPVEHSPALEDFIARYEGIYGEPFTPWAAHGYDSLRMIADTALQNKTLDPDRIAQILRKQGYAGLLQHNRFDANGRLVGGSPVYQMVINGRFQLL